MKKREKKIVITFHTTTDAMAMERYCKKRKEPGRLIPVPGTISAGCGTGISLPEIGRAHV